MSVSTPAYPKASTSRSAMSFLGASSRFGRRKQLRHRCVCCAYTVKVISTNSTWTAASNHTGRSVYFLLSRIMTEHQQTSPARHFSQAQAQALYDACNSVTEHRDCQCELDFPTCSVCLCLNATSFLPSTEPISQDQFMAFFRSDEFHEQMSDDDCRELFAMSLKGASDFTAEFLNDILEDYSVEDIIVVNMKTLDWR